MATSGSGLSATSSPPLCNIGGPEYRIKWLNHLNNAWLVETCDSIAIREGTETLFNLLLSTKVCNFLILIHELLKLALHPSIREV